MEKGTDRQNQRFSIGAMAMLVAICFTFSLAAQPGKKARAQDSGTPKQTAQDKRDAEVFNALSKAWATFYAGKYPEAAKQSEALTKLEARYRWVMVESAWLQSRCYWAADNQQTKAKAQQLWKQVERADTSNATKTRLIVAKAMVLEAEAQAPNVKPEVASQKLKSAIDLLEPLLKGNRWNIQEVEAALVLANLYSNRSVARFDDAKKTLQYIIAYLGDAKNITVMELPPGLEKSHIEASKLALKNLKYDASEGLAEFESAEKLRAEGKFAEAQKAYLKITQDFPNSDYAPRSDLHIGNCYAGLRQISKAIDHWKRFITPLPAGPHRALAYLRIIDYSLEDALDINEANKYAELCRSSLATALADEKASPSWSSAQFDLMLRVGLVSFIAGKNEQAAEAWSAAAKLTDKKTVQESLDALIAAVKSGKGVIPDDVKGSAPGEMKATGTASPKDRASLLLSMGVIHLVAGRLNNAEAMFDRVLGTPAIPAKPGAPGQPARPAMPGATPAQLAFATFGRGAIQQARNRPEEAKELFLASIKAFGDGSWHDESIFRVASIAQNEANSKFGRAPEPAGKPGQPAKSLTPAEKEAAAKAEKERLTALLKTKGEALVYWQELIKRYPQSPRIEQALHNAGVLLCDIAEAAPAAQSENAWKEAISMLSRHCELFPKSPMAGGSYVRQISAATERMFDLELANTISQQAVTWAKSITEGKSDLPESPLLPAWCLLAHYPTYASLRPVFYECYQQAALVAHLRQQKDQAIAFCRLADKFDDSLRSRSGGETAMARMIAVVQGARDSLTPQSLLDALKDDKQKTGILLADLSLMTFDPERAGNLYDRLISGSWPFPRPTAEIESYLFLRIGQALEFQRKHDEAMAYLKRLYDPKYAKYPWAADGIFRIGTWAYNASQDPSDAMNHWEYVFTKNPQHPEAERSLFYYALTAMRTKEYPKAVAAFSEYLKRYPNARWTKRVETELLPDATKHLKENKG